ncbi:MULTISPECIES: ArsR/SmtB family transcription factor [Bacillus]|uniref:ArsR/SmtB family transcription factor n=1 Tax=Bacillus TaxID=1386 RepID=UPI0015749B4B|nr:MULTISPECIES: metalloregulator ArsR/SmtB family transcription factor [Bacillus]MBC6975091.1 helix-turn-helix transcriptional regulator [Bacillus sp. Xin]MBY0600399.1 metalloregulator ArsR/SmtB family transcription factor [Bacillus bingmayongensis]NSW38420.1 helix-turn-helix transcriptional regulator [Bacillus sp. Xin1]
MEELKKEAALLKVLAHPIRLRLLHVLIQNRQCTVSELCHILEVPQSTISQHLTTLKNLDIVSSRRKEAKKLYQVHNETVTRIIQILL